MSVGTGRNSVTTLRHPKVTAWDRLGRVLEAISEPVNLANIKAIVEELTGQVFDPGEKLAGGVVPAPCCQ